MNNLLFDPFGQVYLTFESNQIPLKNMYITLASKC